MRASILTSILESRLDAGAMHEVPVPRDKLETIADSAAGCEPPVRLRELLAVAGLVALADATIYRGQGFAGPAVLFFAAPVLLLWGAPRCRRTIDLGIVGLMLLLLSAALVWCGSIGHLPIGAGLLVAFAMILAGMRPYVVDVFLFSCVTLVTGGAGLSKHLLSLERFTAFVPRFASLKVILPLTAVLGFGTIFICANPDEAQAIGRWLTSVWSSLWASLRDVVPTGPEFLLWVATAWIAGGLLRPLVSRSVFAAPSNRDSDGSAATPLFESPLYAAFRNTLVAVIGLFAVYLVFEFKTLWFRVFPKGFYYAGYAHEGAAWLTAALGLATVVLSGIFRAAILDDPRVPQLKKLAWLWSVENVLLAVAVYHRMYIYVCFNGMTRMRTVGLLGITAVLAGFLLVVWKIVHRRGFVWLINRQLWTLAAAVYLYAILPVDVVVHAYNVRRILAGDIAPSVQISVHPIDSGGILVLQPLVNCKDALISEGIRAMLAERAARAEALERQQGGQNWTSFQLADHLLAEQLRRVEPDWAPYAEAGKRQAALMRFRSYAYQWY